MLNSRYRSGGWARVLRAHPGVVAIVALVAACSVACSAGRGCGNGGSDPVALVRGFVAAAPTAQRADDVCRFVSDQNQASALALARSLAPDIAAAGGADALKVVAEPAKQMGNSHVVLVTGGDGGQIHEFVLERLGNKYLLLPEAESLG